MGNKPGLKSEGDTLRTLQIEKWVKEKKLTHILKHSEYRGVITVLVSLNIPLVCILLTKTDITPITYRCHRWRLHTVQCWSVSCIMSFASTHTPFLTTRPGVQCTQRSPGQLVQKNAEQTVREGQNERIKQGNS